MRVLCCGDRNWVDRDIIHQRLKSLIPAGKWVTVDKPITVVHGCCRGADILAAEEAFALGMDVEGHPAKWGLFGRAAGPKRNQEMLDTGIDLVIAFHSNLKASKGTADMVRRAHNAGVKVMLVI